MLIAHVFHGGALVATAREAFNTLKNHLGNAVATDMVSVTVVSWTTTLFSLGVCLASAAWMDAQIDKGGVLAAVGGAAEGSSDADILIMAMCLGFLYFLKQPLVTLVLLSIVLGNIRINMLAGTFVGLFVGSITNIVFTFAGEVVHNSGDTIMYCFALEAEDGKKQERFAEMYKQMKTVVGEGTPAGSQEVVQGNVVGSADAADSA